VVNIGLLTSLSSLRDASLQGRAHAQSPGNHVRLLWLDESHDAIQIHNLHDEMSQTLCLKPTQFGNNKVLLSKETPFAQQRMLHLSRRVVSLCITT
jgi:hypothetical protein